VLKKFVDDQFLKGLMEELSLATLDFADIVLNIEKFGLDFDDAYQLTISQKYDMTIVTFDNDFR
jgi:predicted nucleic acid-binding protein